MAIYSIEVKCRCTTDCGLYGITAGDVYPGRVELSRHAAPLFIVETGHGCPIRCVHAWFESYFELIK